MILKLPILAASRLKGRVVRLSKPGLGYLSRSSRLILTRVICARNRGEQAFLHPRRSRITDRRDEPSVFYSLQKVQTFVESHGTSSVNVTIIDYGVGNLRSLQRGLEHADATVTVSDDPKQIADAEALVLPGVGAFGECVQNSKPFHDVLVEAAEDTPILGICVGLQLMFTESTEGVPDGETIDGLDLISGRVERLPQTDVKVPHMGWNELTIESDHPIVDGLEQDTYVYFVHSYGSTVDTHTVASCDYGFEFAAIATNEAGNVMGTQFHPEKSGQAGLHILDNFVRYAEAYQRDSATVV